MQLKTDEVGLKSNSEAALVVLYGQDVLRRSDLEGWTGSRSVLRCAGLVVLSCNSNCLLFKVSSAR